MVYELTVQSVHIKTTIFEVPAKLINVKEFSCAIGFAYKQAGLSCPDLQIGMGIEECRAKCLEETNNPNVSEKVREVIEKYVAPPDEIIIDDALVTLKLGYDAGA
ncbi:MAG: DUF3837 family protein [Enterocloster asparagiformis]|nr:DUF3837 family protein [Enterocloster asparagiformis]